MSVDWCARAHVTNKDLSAQTASSLFRNKSSLLLPQRERLVGGGREVFRCSRSNDLAAYVSR